MQKNLLVGLVVLALAIVIVAINLSNRQTDSVPQEATATNMLDDLSQQELGDKSTQELILVVESLVQLLEQEIAERHVLEEALKQTQLRLDNLDEILEVSMLEALRASGPRTVTVMNNNDEVQADSGETYRESRLASMGFTPDQVASFERRQEEQMMAQIELDDQARREGWINTPRYLEEQNNLRATDPIRKDLGDDAYDRYLFATDQPNAVGVRSVVGTSPAEQVGLQAGDIIRSYAGERLFNTQQLTNLRSGGKKGETVTLEIIRNQELLQLTIPRGPMGIYTNATSVDPTVWGGR